jgi:hypothetical protein
MLEFILRVFKGIFSFDAWLSGGRFGEILDDERRERANNRRWSQEFLEQKRLERETRRGFGRIVSRNQSPQQQVTLGRPGSKRTL